KNSSVCSCSCHLRECKVGLNTLAPNLERRFRTVRGKVFQGGVRETCGHIGGGPAQYGTRQLGVGGGGAGPLACFGGEGRSLAARRLERARGFPQGFERGFLHTARISTGQPHAAPEVRLPVLGKGGDGGRKVRDIGPLDKPQTASQPLVK